MRRIRSSHALVIAWVLLGLALAGCGGGDGNEPRPAPPSPPPPPPPSATLPTLSITDVSVSEGQSGTALATFMVTLSAASTQIVTVDYATQDSTAAAGSDYVATSGTLTFAANAVTATIVVSVQGDTAVEPDEVFFLDLDHPVNATLANTRGVGTIDNEDAAAALALSALSNSLLTQDSQAIEVRLGAPAGANGEQVSLSSTDAAIAAITTSVDIPAGETVGYAELTTGATAGKATLMASAAAGTALLTVDTLQRELELASYAEGLSISQSSPATVTLMQPAGAGGLIVDIASSDSGRATVTPASVTIAAGESSAQFNITAVALGSVSISAQIDGRPARAEPLPISILHQAPSGTRTSEELIEAARVAGTLSEEQAYLYLLYAAYGSASLPAAYRGVPSTLPHTPLLQELGVAAPVTSEAGREEVARFQVPPIYGGANASAAVAGKSASVTPSLSKSTGFADVCALLAGATPTNNPGWAHIDTAHFRFWYETDQHSRNIFIDDMELYTPVQAQAAARYLAAIAEPIYKKLTEQFGKEPLSDAGQPCNGGDGRLDVYVARLTDAFTALTSAYPPGCTVRPAWMWLAADRIGSARSAQAVFIHEFMHTIEFAFGKGMECEEYIWLGEALAMWAIDFVYPDNNYEHSAAQPSSFHAGYYAPEGDYQERLDLGAITRGLVGGHYRLRTCNGYCDYPLLFYVARKYGADRIRHLLQFEELYDSIDSLDNTFAPDGGLRGVWPKFALFGWNDWKEGVADEFKRWDKFEGGVKWGHHVPDDLIFEPQLGTASERRIDLAERTNFGHTGDQTSALLRSLTASYVDVVLSDTHISAIELDNRPALLSSLEPDLKVQAMVRIAGTWHGPDDLTDTPYKIWCRDTSEERVEELLLVYSNSSKERRTEGPPGQTDSIDLQVPPNDFDPKLSVSNAGCLGWKGTVKQTVSIPPSYVLTTESSVEFARKRDPGPGEHGVPGREYFKVKEGFVDVSGSGVGPLGCPEQTSAPRTSLVAEDAELLLRLNAPADALNRRATATGGTITLPVTRAIACVGTFTNNEATTWLMLPVDGAALSDDGRHLNGQTDETSVDGAAVHTEWNLEAVKE